MNRLIPTFITGTVLAAGLAVADVPSLINYQGRLTDAANAPVTGSKNFAISIYDASSEGNLLYTEDIGPVTLDANGNQEEFSDSEPQARPSSTSPGAPLKSDRSRNSVACGVPENRA